MANENTSEVKRTEIDFVSEGTRDAIERKSVKYFPDSPSARGFSPDKIRAGFWEAITAPGNSALQEIDRVVKQANEIFENERADRKSAIADEATARDTAISDAKTELIEKIEEEEKSRVASDNNINNNIAQNTAWLEDIQKEIGDDDNVGTLVRIMNPASGAALYGQTEGKPRLYPLSSEAVQYTVPIRDKDKRLYAGKASDKGSTDQVVNVEYFNGRMETDVAPRFTALETALSGKARSYVFETLDALATAINGTGVFDCSAFLTGDNLLIVQKDVPDFWFEATGEDDTRNPTYTYEDAEGNRSEYSLVVYNYADNNTYRVGLLHILESDYTVIEGYSKAASTAAGEAEKSARNADTDASRAEAAAENAEAQAERAEAAADRAELFGDAFATDASGFAPVNIIADGAPGIEEDAFWGTSGLLTGYTSYKSYAELLGVIAGAEYLIPQFKGVISFYNADKTKHTNIDFTSGSLADRRFTVPDGSVWMGVSFDYRFDPAAYINRLTPTEDERAAFPIYSERLLVKQKNIGTSLARMISPVHGETIVNFGDSIFGNARPPEDVSTMLAEMTGATVHNCAFGGCRMSVYPNAHFDAFSMYRLADAIASGDWSRQEEALEHDDRTSYAEEPMAILKGLDFSQVDIVTIAYGTNDFTASRPIDNAENQDDTNSVCGALRYSIERLLNTYPQLRIFVLLPTWRFWMDGNKAFTEDSSTRVNDIGKTLPDYVVAIEDTAKSYNIPVIDNYKELGINKFNRTQYFPATDGTHHNENGRRLIARHVAKKLY